MDTLVTAVFWSAAAVAGLVGLLLALLAAWAYCGFKPKSSKATLKNGMEITQWQQMETDFLFKEIFEDECYRAGPIKFKPGDTIVDAGANIGMFSMWAFLECKKDARIFSFEPIPTTYACLKANSEAHGSGKIKAFNVGLSDKPAQITFDHHPFMSIWSTSDGSMDDARMARLAHDLPCAVAAGLAADKSPLAIVPVWVWRLLVNIFLVRAGEREPVPATLRTLGDVLSEEGVSKVDLLKVDVEGAELMVLQGVKEEQWSGIQQVTLEVENFETVYAVRDFLKARGFHVAWRPTELEQVMEARLKSGQNSQEKVVSQVSHLFATRAPLPGDCPVNEEGRMLAPAGGASTAAGSAASPAPQQAASPGAPNSGGARRRRRREE